MNMRRTHYIRTMFAALLVSTLLASCTQDELAGNQDTPLPSGKYPLTLTSASLGGLQSVTRSTVENKWKGGEEVYVQVIDNYTSGEPEWDNATKQTYTVANDGTMTKFVGDDVYWQISTEQTEQKAIRAWCLGGRAAASGEPPSYHAVETDQSTDSYAQSDFLYAGCISDFAGGKNGVNLQFYHQVAKLKIHIARGDDTPAVFSITELTIDNVAIQGNFTAPEISGTDNQYGRWSMTGQQTADITPHADNTTDTYLASYEAIVIPQTVQSGTKLFTVTADGYGSSFVYTTTENKEWEPGKEYTYTVTIKGNKVEVSVSANSIGWTPGNTANGEVEL